MKLSKSVVRDEMDLPYGGSDRAEIIRDTMIDTSRWTVDHELIVKIDGVLYSCLYGRGTGDEGELPWEYDDEVEFTPVREITKTVIEYEPF